MRALVLNDNIDAVINSYLSFLIKTNWLPPHHPVKKKKPKNKGYNRSFQGKKIQEKLKHLR